MWLVIAKPAIIIFNAKAALQVNFSAHFTLLKYFYSNQNLHK
jgi:hypothetical protein